MKKTKIVFILIFIGVVNFSCNKSINIPNLSFDNNVINNKVLSEESFNPNILLDSALSTKQYEELINYYNQSVNKNEIEAVVRVLSISRHSLFYYNFQQIKPHEHYCLALGVNNFYLLLFRKNNTVDIIETLDCYDLPSAQEGDCNVRIVKSNYSSSLIESFSKDSFTNTIPKLSGNYKDIICIISYLGKNHKFSLIFDPFENFLIEENSKNIEFQQQVNKLYEFINKAY